MNQRQAKQIALNFAWSTMDSAYHSADWEGFIRETAGTEPTDAGVGKVRHEVDKIVQSLFERHARLEGR